MATILYPYVLYLLIPTILLLLLNQFFRKRRQRILVGSIQFWRGLAQKLPATKKRRLILDLSFWLQVFLTALLFLTLSAPVLVSSTKTGRKVVLLLDNGAPSRARIPGQKTLWPMTQNTAFAFLKTLSPDDNVQIVCSGPKIKILNPQAKNTEDKTGFYSPSQAIEIIKGVQPFLTSADTKSLWDFAESSNANLDSAVSISIVAVSPASPPINYKSKPNRLWISSIHSDSKFINFPNVGLISAGSADWKNPTSNSSNTEIQICLQNFGSHVAKGKLICSDVSQGDSARHAKKVLVLKPYEKQNHFFQISSNHKNPIQITWEPEQHDALPEDNSIVLMPNNPEVVRIRMFGSAPAIETFFQKTLGAEIVKANEKPGKTTLHIYAEIIPAEIPGPESTSGIICLAPAKDFGPISPKGSDFQPKILQLGSYDPLVKDFSTQSLQSGKFKIEKARSLAITGAFKTLLLDEETSNPIVGRFQLDDGRPVLASAYIPTEPLNPMEGAFLLRFFGEIRSEQTPYSLQTCGQREIKTGIPTALTWKPDKFCGGVLDEKISNLNIGGATSNQNPGSFGHFADSPQKTDFIPWLIPLVLLIAGYELWILTKRIKSNP